MLRSIDRDVLAEAKERVRDEEGQFGRSFDDVLVILIEMYANGEIALEHDRQPKRGADRRNR
jgi:hypothetical protein